jgi:hypothetical protein
MLFAAASGGHRILAGAVHIANFLGIHKIMLCAFTSLNIQAFPAAASSSEGFFLRGEASTKRNKQLLMT